MTPAQKTVFGYIRRKAQCNYVTPSVKEISQKTGYSESGVQTALSGLRKQGLVRCTRNPGGSIKLMAALTRAGWRWTKEASPRGAVGAVAASEWGAGPIVRLWTVDPDKAQEMENEIFGGRVFEDMRFRT